MKKLTALFSVIILIAPLLYAEAQSENIKTNIDDNENCVKYGINKVGDNIGEILDRVMLQWDLRNKDEQIIEGDSINSKTRRSTDITDDEIDTSEHTFSGGKVIKEYEIITGNVVVRGGDLTVYGKVDGDVQVVGGDLHLKKTGWITGNARVVNGSILKEDGAIIDGFEDKASEARNRYREPRQNFTRSGRSFDVLWQNEEDNLDNFIFRYNRVESLFLGVGTEKKFYWDGARKWNAYGSIGWGFRSHAWRGNLGLVRQFAILSDEGSGIIELGAEGYNLTDSKDKWIISLHENTASALLIHEDFRDYFERRGYTVHMAYYTKQDYLKSEIKVAYLEDIYDSLSNRIDWAFFGGNKKFRENPAIDPGSMRSLMVSGGVSTISKTSYGSEGWCLFGSAEFAMKSWDSKFGFNQYIVDLRRFQPLGRYENLNFRIRMGSSEDSLPRQKAYELGGVGTINAYPFKSEIGNRMLLINAEFILNGSFFDELDFWPTWLFSNFNYLFTSDAGYSGIALPSASATEGFESVKWNAFKHSFGVALANRSGSFRIGFAWRTDHPAPVQLILRFCRPF